MKIKKLNKKEYLAVMASLVLVATVGAGISVAVTDKPQNSAELPQNNVVAEVPHDESQAVDANKNASAKTDTVANADNTKNFVQAELKAEEPVAETSQKEAALDEAAFDEYDEAAAIANEITLEWPIKGEVVMEFSTDKTVFDPTLEQYRTNDSVCILANEGTAVKAACDGTVADVFTDYEKGITVVINHADGWSTTYSQLDKDLAVEKGEAVKKGQNIGKVAAPTKYGAAMGSHLDFKVCQGEFAIDPKVAIAN